MKIEKVDLQDLPHFKSMAEAYWQELMPQALVLQDPERREAHFQDNFAWDDGNRHPHWALVNNRPIGFMSFEVYEETKRAVVDDFYVDPQYRRKGYGSAMVKWLFSHLDNRGIEQIDLNVRRDNPKALAFWQAQGFGIAGYRLRQLRDPRSRTAFKEVLSSDF